MKQIVITGHGGPEKLKIQESPDPTPSDGALRIRVKASGIDFADILARQGLYPDSPKIPCVVGYEVSGRWMGWVRASTNPGSARMCLR